MVYICMWAHVFLKIDTPTGAAIFPGKIFFGVSQQAKLVKFRMKSSQNITALEKLYKL